MTATLVLFTGSYPYDEAAESTFVGPELPHLAAAFDRVVLVPASLGGAPEAVPPGVEVSEEYAALETPRLTPAALGSALASGGFYREVVAQAQSAARPAAIARIARHASVAGRTARWLPGFVRRQRIDAARTVFYTYWLGGTTLGVARLPSRGALISRAHGYDLYHDRHTPAFVPLQRATLSALDGLFLACEHARAYVRARFPDLPTPCEVHRLGVRHPGAVVSRASEDGVLRLVSCAYLSPVKRMELLARGIARAGRSRRDRKIEWVHFGGGAEERDLRRVVAEILPDNVAVEWRGTVPNDEVLRHYRERPVDLFVTASASEGGVPVSMTEAQSHGIPAVGPRVGGIPDILSERNGVLLPPNPSEAEIGEAIASFFDAPVRVLAMRAESRRICMAEFDADVNSARFAARLRSMIL